MIQVDGKLMKIFTLEILPLKNKNKKKITELYEFK